MSTAFADELLKTALIQLKTSTDFKRERLRKIKEAEDMLLGKVKAKTRQQFNVPLPVLSGFFDTLCSDLDDPIRLEVKNNPNRNLEAVSGINEMISAEKKSLRVGARWDYKDRIAKKSAIASGRAFLKIFSSADPYQTTLEAPLFSYMHCQPRGGGLLERHLFVGEEGVMRTKYQLEEGARDGVYYGRNVQDLIEKSQSKDYQEKLSAFQDEQDKKFKALNLDPDANNYVGEQVFNLCEWVLNKNGERWYLLFDPWNRIWVRAEKLTDIYSSGLYPWKSYATHEDDENFWSTSILSDILYPIADSIVTSFNQELTNRQKRNLNARFYDKEMIKNVGKLDEAQYRPDALVPVDTFGGTRKISEGVYQFTTPELTGTIDLVSWLSDWTGKQTGIYQDLAPIQKKGGRMTNNIVFAQIQQLAKRTDYRSHSYSECWGEVILSYIDGLKKNLTNEEAMNLIGPELGYGFKENLKKIKLTKEDIQITSTKEQAKEDALQKQQKTSSLTLLASDTGINPDWRRRHILSDVGGWEEEEIEEALDLRGLGGAKDQLAVAEEAIRDLLKKKKPEMCWNATTIFQRKILDFATVHRNSLVEKGVFESFVEYVRSHNQIVQENMKQLAERLKSMGMMNQGSQGGQPQDQNPQSKILPEKMSGRQGQPTPVAPSFQ